MLEERFHSRGSQRRYRLDRKAQWVCGQGSVGPVQETGERQANRHPVLGYSGGTEAVAQVSPVEQPSTVGQAGPLFYIPVYIPWGISGRKGGIRVPLPAGAM